VFCAVNTFGFKLVGDPSEPNPLGERGAGGGVVDGDWVLSLGVLASVGEVVTGSVAGLASVLGADPLALPSGLGGVASTPGIEKSGLGGGVGVGGGVGGGVLEPLSVAAVPVPAS